MSDDGPNTFVVPQPSTELKRLEPLVGKWHTQAKTKAGVSGPSVPVTSIEEFYWLEGGYFLVQTYDTVFGDEPSQTGINYWFFDDAAQKFRIIFFSNNGPFTEDGNRYEGEIGESTLTFTGPARFQYDLDQAGRVKKNDDGSVLIKWWLRDEDGQFQPWMDNLFKPSTISLEDELLTIERRLWTNDATVYAANLTQDAVLVFPETGLIPRETALAAIRQENAEGRRWAEVKIDNVLASPLTSDTALLTYRVTARWEHERSPIAALASSIYVRRDRRWKLAFHQQTALASR